MKPLVCVLSTLSLVSCSCGPKEPPVLIQTVDGCKVYKVDAGSRYVYTTICPDRQRTSWTEQQGKSYVPADMDTVTK